MIRIKELTVLTLIIILVPSIYGISNVQHSVEGTELTLTYEGTPPFLINIRRDQNIGDQGGYVWAKTNKNSFTIDLSFVVDFLRNFFYGVKDDEWSDTNNFYIGQSHDTCESLTGEVCESYEVCDGTIITADNSNRCCSGVCKLPKSFDWRDKHGENWLSPVRSQGTAGNCWAFGDVGTFESQINLYFNQHLDVDLSEQMLADCIFDITNPDSYIGVHENCVNYNCAPANLYCFYRYLGIPDEQCNPYFSAWPGQGRCSSDYTCSDWKDRAWKTTNFYDHIYGNWDLSSDCPQHEANFSEEDYKSMIIDKGPISVRANSWSHGMVLVGYENELGDWKTIDYCDIVKNEICIPSEGCISRECDNPGEEIVTCVNDYQYYWNREVKSGIYTYKCENRGDNNYWTLENSIICQTNTVCVENECIDSSLFQLTNGQIECTKYHTTFNPDYFNAQVEYSPGNGDTIWIFKNSWDSNWDEDGYAELALPPEDIKEAMIPLGPFIPPEDENYWPDGFNNEVKCVDKDNDGYCNWGISKNKPSTCSRLCESEKDWDDSEPNIGALDVY